MKSSSKSKVKKVIYTCITGDYDDIIEPDYITERFDYICFTDNKELKSEHWQIRLLEGEEFEGLSNVKKQRFVKASPHLFLKEYDLSIWVDGNMRVLGDLNEYISRYCYNNSDVFIPTHPNRDCIYDEMKACKSMSKDNAELMEDQVSRYMKEGYPTDFGLVQSNIIIRKHNKPACIKLMEDWWGEIKEWSHRDQLSFNYCAWKNPKAKITLLGFKTCQSDWFKWTAMHKHVRKCLTKPKEIVVKKPQMVVEEERPPIINDETRYIVNNLERKVKERIEKRKKFVSFYRR